MTWTMQGLQGKVVLVTGGTRGIGEALSLAFAAAGSKVAILAREESDVVSTIQKSGGEACFIKVDIAKATDVASAIEHSVERFGRLDFAINNAGIIGAMTPLHICTEQNFDDIVGVNIKGTWLCMKHEIQQMLTQGGGVIVNIASVVGLVAMPNVGIYTATKHGVIGLTKAAAIEYAQQGIRVNAICPSMVRTAMNEATGEAGLAALGAMHPMGRIGTPQEIAGAALWLCSAHASFVTGQTVCVDGGYTAQ